MQNQHVSLVLSTDAKPRLKWTAELHQRFADSVLQLGGADKATPKSLMRVMGIPGLTLYHLKSHLQKFRLGRSQRPESSSDHLEDYKEVHGDDDHIYGDSNDGSQNQTNDTKISQALEMQLEIQRKLHEQIKVQRHLQLRIEAQGKYLQTVLKKAQETLAGYSSSSSEVAKQKLSQLVSIVDNGGPSSSLSELTEMEGGRGTMVAIESSLTSSESSPSVELSLMEFYRTDLHCIGQKKRSRSLSCDENGEDKVRRKRSAIIMEDEKLTKMIDLNSRFEYDYFEISPKEMDSNGSKSS